MARHMNTANSDRLSELLDEIDHATDPRQAWLQVRDTIAEFRQTGRDLPPKLIALERQLASECIAHSQGR